MRRRDEYHARSLRQPARIQTISIDRYGQEARAGGAKHFSRALVAGVFNGDAIAPLDQHACHQVQGLLRAADDDDLRWVAEHGARAAQVHGNRLAKRDAAARRPIIQCAYRCPACVAQQHAAPHLKGEDFDITAAVCKIVARTRRRLAQEIRFGRGARGAPIAGQANFDAAGARAGAAGGQDVGDVSSRAAAAHHEPFRQQLFVGQHHHGSGNVQLLGQFTRRGQPFRVAHDPPQDCLTKPKIDLA